MSTENSDENSREKLWRTFSETILFWSLENDSNGCKYIAANGWKFTTAFLLMWKFGVLVNFDVFFFFMNVGGSCFNFNEIKKNHCFLCSCDGKINLNITFVHIAITQLPSIIMPIRNLLRDSYHTPQYVSFHVRKQ